MRTEGYYWVLFKNQDEPRIAHWTIYECDWHDLGYYPYGIWEHEALSFEECLMDADTIYIWETPIPPPEIPPHLKR